MSDKKDMVHILRLLDDESPKVRGQVWEKLASNLPAWEADIRMHLDGLTMPVRTKLLSLMTEKARSSFRASWLRWRDLTDEMEKLEAGLSCISLFLSGGFTHGGEAGHRKLAALLDGLAQDFRETGLEARPGVLAEFLFVERGLSGADADYYDPGNSDLAQVIVKGRGIPITLACVFILVGFRLGLDIAGCDVPEHFLTRAREGAREVIIDCFDGGRELGPERLSQLELKYAPEFTRLLRSTAKPEAIIARVLRNLINAYHLSGDKPASEFFWTLADDLRGEQVGSEDLD